MFPIVFVIHFFSTVHTIDFQIRQIVLGCARKNGNFQKIVDLMEYVSDKHTDLGVKIVV